MRKFYLSIPIWLIVGVLHAQTAGRVPPEQNNTWYVGTIALPGTATTVAVPTNALTGTKPTVVFVDQINLSNTSGSDVTVTVSDSSTNCNAAACSPVPGITVAAHTVYAIPLHGAPFSGAIKWSASTANVIHGSMIGRY